MTARTVLEGATILVECPTLSIHAKLPLRVLPRRGTATTLSQLRRRVNAFKRQFAHELAIIKLRRIAPAVSNDWTPSEPPEPSTVIQRVVKAGFRLTTFVSLHR